MHTQIKHIFFDLDNTLWDTDKNSFLTLQQMFSEMKIEEEYPLDFLSFYKMYYSRNEKLWSLYSQNKITKQEILDKRFNDTFHDLGISDSIILDFFNLEFLNKVVENNNMVQNAEETLIYLKNHGYDIHVISNGFIKQTQRKISGSSIKNYVSTITSGEEINKRKPSKEVFELGLQKAGAKAEESSFVGDDWEADILGSQAAGMLPVFFDYKKEIKYSQNGFPIVSDLLELKRIF